MRTIAKAGMGTLTAAVLLGAYGAAAQRGEPAAVAAPAVGTGTASDATSGGTSSGDTGGATAAGSGITSGTFTGDAVDTRWGPVQVRITVEGGRITSAEAVTYPNENHRDAEINGYALPLLNQEVVDAQGAQIDAVSGATVTSTGYVQSLQSALDQARS
ncbi:MAG: FMN-binding protein [Kineosporiaceae bacterium]